MKIYSKFIQKRAEDSPVDDRRHCLQQSSGHYFLQLKSFNGFPHEYLRMLPLYILYVVN